VHAFMSWPAVFLKNNGTLRKSLISKFEVTHLPRMVLIDPKNGRVVKRSVLEDVLSDPEGASFPWKEPSLSELFKDNLISCATQKAVDVKTLEGKVVGLYFGGEWCPYCPPFSKKLAQVYAKLQQQNVPMEVIYISYDKGKEKFDKYTRDMPWLTSAFNNKEITRAISDRFPMRALPALKTVEWSTGRVVAQNCKDSVDSDPEGKSFPWGPKPVMIISKFARLLNNSTALVVFSGTTPSADGKAPPAEPPQRTVSALEDALRPEATRRLQMSEEDSSKSLLFFIALEGGVGPDAAVTTRLKYCIRKFDEEANKVMCVLDLRSRKCWWSLVSSDTQVTEASVGTFLADWQHNSIVPELL